MRTRIHLAVLLSIAKPKSTKDPINFTHYMPVSPDTSLLREKINTNQDAVGSVWMDYWNRHSQALRQAASSPDDTYHTIPVAALIVLYSQRYKPRTDQLPRESQTNRTNGYFGPQSLNDSNPKEMLTHPNLKDMPTQSTHKTCQPAIGTSRTLPWWLNDTHRWLLLLPRVYSTNDIHR